jgi:hypothetical protein
MTTDVETLHRISSVKHGWRKNDWCFIGKMGDAKSIFGLQDPEERKERKKKIAPAGERFKTPAGEQPLTWFL